MTEASGGSEPAVRVSKLGYVQFSTPDVDRLVDYYTKVLDFELVEQAPQGAFLTTGFDHHSVVISPGDTRAGRRWATRSGGRSRTRSAGCARPGMRSNGAATSARACRRPWC